jgi:hypothetical protein
MITKGKSTTLEKSQLGDIESAIPMHSESGCFTIQTFEEYLQISKREFPEDEPINLILDCYSVPRS